MSGCGCPKNLEMEKKIFREKYNKALKYEKEEKYDKAISLLYTLVNGIPEKSEQSIAILYYKIGDDYIKSKFYNRAKEAFQEFILRYPDHKEVPRFETAMVYCSFKEGLYDRALCEYSVLLEKYWNTERAALVQLGIAETYGAKKEYEKAVEHYEGILVDFPDSTYSQEAYYKIPFCLEHQGKYEEAIEKYRYAMSVLKEQPLIADTHLGMGRCFEKIGKLLEAQKEYEFVIKEYPNTEQSLRAQKKLNKTQEGKKGRFTLF